MGWAQRVNAIRRMEPALLAERRRIAHEAGMYGLGAERYIAHGLGAPIRIRFGESRYCGSVFVVSDDDGSSAFGFERAAPDTTGACLVMNQGAK